MANLGVRFFWISLKHSFTAWVGHQGQRIYGARQQGLVDTRTTASAISDTGLGQLACKLANMAMHDLG